MHATTQMSSTLILVEHDCVGQQQRIHTDAATAQLRMICGGVQKMTNKPDVYHSND